MKKFIKPLTIALVFCTMLLGFTFIGAGCGGGSGPFEHHSGRYPPAKDQLIGSWELIETSHRSDVGGLLGCISGSVTHRPGSTHYPGWLGGYFIAFRDDGTFSEQNFWNYYLNTINGTWSLSDNGSLALNNFAPQIPWSFIGLRHLSLCENYLIMTYTRHQYGTWHYIHTFIRTGDAPPPTGGF